MATATEDITSPEEEALTKAFNYLVKSIDTDSLLPAALSRNLITNYQRSDCVCEPNPYKKAEKFVDHLLRAVNGDSDKFYIFMQVLLESGQSSIAKRMNGQ